MCCSAVAHYSATDTFHVTWYSLNYIEVPCFFSEYLAITQEYVFRFLAFTYLHILHMKLNDAFDI